MGARGVRRLHFDVVAVLRFKTSTGGVAAAVSRPTCQAAASRCQIIVGCDLREGSDGIKVDFLERMSARICSRVFILEFLLPYLLQRLHPRRLLANPDE